MLIISAFIALSGLLLASAVFFDRISTGELKSLVAGRIEGISPISQASFPKFTRYFIRQTIVAAFPGSIFQWRHFLSAALFSAVAMSVIVVCFSIANHISIPEIFDISIEQVDVRRIFSVFIIFVSTVLADAVSFIKTAFFMKLISKLSSFREMMVVAIADIILTISVFVFMMPVLLQIDVIIQDKMGASARLYIQNITPRNRPDDGDYSTATIFMFAQPNESAASKDERASLHAINLTYRDADPNDFGRALFSRLGLSYSTGSASDSSNSGFDFDATYGDVRMHDIFGSELWPSIYGRVFIRMQQVQSSFTSILTLSVVKINVEEAVFYYSLDELRVPSPFAGQFFTQCDGRSSWSQERPEVAQCETFIQAEIGDQLKSIYQVVFAESRGGVPVSPLILTSFLLTAAFYAAMALSVVSMRLARVFHKLAFVRKFLAVHEQPFAAAAILVITCALPFVALAAGVFALADML